MSKNLELKSVSELIDKNFFIPAYQRGYRWNSRQVEDLLEDIMEFARKKSRTELKKKEFYCLQPVVIKRENDEYRVIDGQQRLTTLFIILKYCEDARKILYSNNTKLYSIKYETRSLKKLDGNDFLETIKNLEKFMDENSNIVNNTENIDFYFMSNTYITVKKWFEKPNNNISQFLDVLLTNDIVQKDDKKIDIANNVRVIWYEIENTDSNPNDEEIKVFTRLNIGKIPLTNAELIKALFLIKIDKNNTNKKILLSSQWDDIEYKLQDDEFFSFIHSDSKNYDNKYPTRIEYIFELITEKEAIQIPNLQQNDEKKSYYMFNMLLDDVDSFQKYFEKEISTNKEEYSKVSSRVEFLWDKVKTIFRIFSELYHNNTYYHLVGYLIHNDYEIKKIIDAFEDKTKDDFESFLRREIKNIIKLPKKEIHQLTYKDDYTTVTKMLFLFNVVTTMKICYSRYPFHLHQKEQWSLEHIHAQNSDDIKNLDDRQTLINSQLNYIKEPSLKLKAEEILKKRKINDEEFSAIQKEIFAEHSDDKDSIEIHTLDNLALLSGKVNSSLNSSIFPEKRDKIKLRDKEGSFIPICTKNVFLKYYSDDVKESLTWNKADRDAYLKEIIKELEPYLGEIRNG